MDDVILFNEDPYVDDLDNSQDEQFSVSELDQESWQDWYSEDLLNMYLSLIEYCEEVSLVNYMSGISFNTFCEYVSSGGTPGPERDNEDLKNMYTFLSHTGVTFGSFCTFIFAHTK